MTIMYLYKLYYYDWHISLSCDIPYMVTLGVIFSTNQQPDYQAWLKSNTHWELLSDWPNIQHTIGLLNMSEKLPDIIPYWKLLDFRFLAWKSNKHLILCRLICCVYIIAMLTKVIWLYMLAVAEINLRTDTALPPAFVVLWLTSYSSNRFIAPTIVEGS